MKESARFIFGRNFGNTPEEKSLRQVQIGALADEWGLLQAVDIEAHVTGHFSHSTARDSRILRFQLKK